MPSTVDSPKPGPCRRLGGEERLEYLVEVRGRDAGAVSITLRRTFGPGCGSGVIKADDSMPVALNVLVNRDICRAQRERAAGRHASAGFTHRFIRPDGSGCIARIDH